MAKLILMVGIPGSGKTTFANTMFDEDTIILSSDGIRKELFGSEADQDHNDIVFQTLYSRARENLANNKTVVLDSTNSSKENRKRALSHFTNMNISISAIVIDTNLETCIKQNAQRERVVEESVIKEFADSFSFPTKDEGFDEIITYTNHNGTFKRKLKTTLLMIVKDNKVCLAKKKRGFGAGLYNGVGGKVEPGESVEAAAIRETQEEANVTVTDIKKVANIVFDEFVKGYDTIVDMSVYISNSYIGDLSESNETEKPEWFDISDIPYDKMFPDDKFWLPEILNGNYVEGYFEYDKDLNLLSHNIKIIK